MLEKISLIIPCKNEIESLGAVLNEIKDIFSVINYFENID